MPLLAAPTLRSFGANGYAKTKRFMKYKTMLITLLACLTLLASCAKDECPMATAPKPEYYFNKKVKMKYTAKKRKPTPSLIHITRVNYKPQSH